MSNHHDIAYTGNPQEFMARVSKIPNLSRDEELRLIHFSKDYNDMDARQTLVASHQKFVVKLIYKTGLSRKFGDALTAGNIGLLKAIERFEEDKGVRLSTYASWWIKAELADLWQDSIVPMGSSAERKRVRLNLRRAASKVVGPEGQPTIAHFNRMAEMLGTSPKTVMEMYPVVIQGDVSLDAPLTDEEGASSRGDFLVDEDVLSPEDMAVQIDLVERAHAHLEDALDVLNDRERHIFRSRRLTEDPPTLQVLANEFGISKERVRQIEERAFEKVSASVRGAVESADRQAAELRAAGIPAPA